MFRRELKAIANLADKVFSTPRHHKAGVAFMEETNSAIVYAYTLVALGGCFTGLFIGWLFWG